MKGPALPVEKKFEKNSNFTKHFSPIGPAVWPAIGDKYTNVLFYYIDKNDRSSFVKNKLALHENN